MNKILLYRNNTEMVIYNDNTVFGDGTHESTTGMLDMMAGIDLAGKSVLDIGTGTGILSVYAALCGAKVTAVDMSPAAMEFARKNFDANGVTVDLIFNDLTRDIEKKFDLIVANLAAPVQVENLKTVEKCMAEEGRLIISWLNYLPLERYARGFEVIDRVEGTEYDVYKLRAKKEET